MLKRKLGVLNSATTQVVTCQGAAGPNEDPGLSVSHFHWGRMADTDIMIPNSSRITVIE